MKNIGFTDDERIEIYKIIAIIMHLNNISFIEKEIGENCKIMESSKNSVLAISKLLNKTEENIEPWLVYRNIAITGEELFRWVFL